MQHFYPGIQGQTKRFGSLLKTDLAVWRICPAVPVLLCPDGLRLFTRINVFYVGETSNKTGGNMRIAVIDGQGRHGKYITEKLRKEFGEAIEILALEQMPWLPSRC